MKREPIWIRCEGSHAESPYCPMCAIAGAVIGGGTRIPEHNRRDILAELQRGDFGELDDNGAWHGVT